MTSGLPVRRPGLPPMRRRARAAFRSDLVRSAIRGPPVGDGAEHLQGEQALRGGGVGRIAQATEMRAA
jgi:hypothetical protein